MTQYPQAQPVFTPPTPPVPPYMPPPAPRNSGLAIAGFVCSLIFCCPGLGLLGAVFSFAGLFVAGRPGRKGRGFAIAGLVIGLVVTLGQASFAVWLWNRFQEADAAVSRFIDHYNRGEYKATYQESSPLLKKETSQADYIALMAKVQRAWGKAQRVSLGESLSSGAGKFDTRQGVALGGQTVNVSVLTVELNFEKGGKQPVEFTFVYEDEQLRLAGVNFPAFKEKPESGLNPPPATQEEDEQ